MDERSVRWPLLLDFHIVVVGAEAVEAVEVLAMKPAVALGVLRAKPWTWKSTSEDNV